MKPRLCLPRLAMPFLRLMVLFVLVTVASGCIPLGVPIFPEGDPFTEKKLDFIETGTTTKDEILGTLAEPPYKLEPQVFHGGKVLIYRTDQKGWGGAGCVLVVLPVEDPAGCGVARGTKNHLLLLRFDEQGIVDYWFEGEGDYFPNLDIAAIALLDLQFQEDGSGLLTHDGRTVEAARAVMRFDGGYQVRFQGSEEMLLVVKLETVIAWRKIYFGDVKPVRDAAIAATTSEGIPYYRIDSSTLEELNAGLP